MKHWFIVIQGGFLALLLWVFPLAAQQNELLDGHILEQIQLSSEADDTFLYIRGILSPALLPSVKLIQGDDPNHLTISIPSALTNNLILPQTINFKPSDVLETIEIEEDILEGSRGDLQFQVNLHITSRQPIVLSPEQLQTNTQQLAFLVLEKGAAGEIETEAQADSGMPSLPLLSDRSGVTTPSGMQMKESDKVLLHPVSAMMAFQRPSVLHLSILNASPRKEAARRLAVLLDRHQRKYLEDRLDMKMDITNISSVREQMALSKTKIYFRPNYLTAALALATVIPGEQVVEQMSLERRGRLGLDVEIYVGANFE